MQPHDQAGKEWQGDQEQEDQLPPFGQAADPERHRTAQDQAQHDRQRGKAEGAGKVFVTGFQTIPSIAQDFTRRLSIVRGSARFLSPHDGGLVEWIPSFRRADEARCLVMVDMAPLAREALPILQTARRLGMAVVVVTDELNTWAAPETPFVFHVTTKVDAFLESTGPMTTLMNVIIHAVAGKSPDQARKRIKDWPPIMRGLDLY